VKKHLNHASVASGQNLFLEFAAENAL
jgi:hypothetical protein